MYQLVLGHPVLRRALLAAHIRRHGAIIRDWVVYYLF